MTTTHLHTVPTETTAAPSRDQDGVLPFIPQRPTLRALTDRTISRDELKAYKETVIRAHRMIESALDKLIAG